MLTERSAQQPPAAKKVARMTAGRPAALHHIPGHVFFILKCSRCLREPLGDPGARAFEVFTKSQVSQPIRMPAVTSGYGVGECASPG